MKHTLITLMVLCLLHSSGCTTKTTGNSQSEGTQSDTTLTAQPNAMGNSGNPTDQLTSIYTQAIGDYIRLVKEEYTLTFDTLFFGKHVYNQPDDFPDIELPSSIGTTKIKLISPEEGEKHQRQKPSSYYINLIGSVGTNSANFIFVTFSNGFAHQFDCTLNYVYDSTKKGFVMESSQFKNYLYKPK